MKRCSMCGRPLVWDDELLDWVHDTPGFPIYCPEHTASIATAEEGGGHAWAEHTKFGGTVVVRCENCHAYAGEVPEDSPCPGEVDA